LAGGWLTALNHWSVEGSTVLNAAQPLARNKYLYGRRAGNIVEALCDRHTHSESITSQFLHERLICVRVNFIQQLVKRNGKLPISVNLPT